MKYLEPVDHTAPGFGELYDELPLWSAPFGLLLLDQVPMKPGLTILDVGAGTGWLTLELAERCGATARILAVDPWAEGMKRLRRKIDQRGLGNVLLFEQDAATLALADESVDVIVSNLGINNFENPDAVLGVCHRAAKPGATLLLTTNLTGHMEEFYRVYREVLIELGRRDRLEALEANIRHRGTLDSVAGRLEQAGFTVADRVLDSFRMRFADGSSLLRHHFVRLGFMEGWKSVAPPDAVERTFELLERRLNDEAGRRGDLSLTVPMGLVVAHKPETGGAAENRR